MTNIKYSEKLSSQNNNIIYFISKYQELSNISILEDIKYNLKTYIPIII